MTNEEKNELLIALCSYYPYGVICHDTDPNDPNYSKDGMLRTIRKEPSDCNGLPYLFELDGISSPSDICEIKPYLRPMDSMTGMEIICYQQMLMCVFDDGSRNEAWNIEDWLNENFLDYRNLIPKGLALEAKEEMYKVWEEGEVNPEP